MTNEEDCTFCGVVGRSVLWVIGVLTVLGLLVWAEGVFGQEPAAPYVAPEMSALLGDLYFVDDTPDGGALRARFRTHKPPKWLKIATHDGVRVVCEDATHMYESAPSRVIQCARWEPQQCRITDDALYCP